MSQFCGTRKSCTFLILKLLLKKSGRSPSCLCRMTQSVIRVYSATLHHMSHNAVSMVSRFGTSMVHRLSWVVLLVPHEADIRHRSKRSWEIVQQPSGHRDCLPDL